MKLMPTVAASLFAIMAALSINASTAADNPADTKVEQVAPAMKMKPHSHVQEKLGFAPKAPEPTPEKPNAANDRTKHFHPRDGK